MPLSASNFNLYITEAAQGFAVQVRSEQIGDGLQSQPFSLPVDLTSIPLARRNVAEWVKQARVTRLRGSEEIQLAQSFGSSLFNSIFTNETLAAFRTSRVGLPRGERLNLRLHLPAKLALLPWELLFDTRNDEFLALAPDIALVRYTEVTRRNAPLRIVAPLQMVVVLASPASENYLPINLERELRRLERALKEPREQGLVTLDVIRGSGTLDQLRMRARKPIHILHILCHGDIDNQNGEGFLVFDDMDGAAEPVSAELLRQQLQRQQGQTQLVMLNACLGALPVGNDPFSSVAAALVRGGVPAVIAMQFEIAEDVSAELTRVFYAELAAGAPVDTALTTARLHLYGRYRHQLDWAIPVLFMSAESDALFDVAPPPPPLVAVETPSSAPTTAPTITPSIGRPQPLRQMPVWYWAALAVLVAAVVLLGYMALRSPASPQNAGVATVAPGPTSTPQPTAEPQQPTLAPAPTTALQPTSAPASTAMPRPTLVAAGPPDYIYDFGSGNIQGWVGEPPVWQVIKDDTGRFVYRAAGLPFSATIDNSTKPNMDMSTWTNYAVEASLRIVQPTPAEPPDYPLNDVIITLRGNDTLINGCLRYVLFLDTDGASIVREGPDDAPNSCPNKTLATTPAGLTLNQWHDVRMEVNGSNITLAIDGKPILETTDQSLPSGEFYFTVSNQVILDIASVRVYKLAS